MRTEADDGREVGELGVADALRDGEAGDGDAGEEVVLELAEGVARRPLEGRDEVLEPAPRALGGRERPEPPERVVGEERLREARPQHLRERPLRRQVHLVLRRRRAEGVAPIAGSCPHELRRSTGSISRTILPADRRRGRGRGREREERIDEEIEPGRECPSLCGHYLLSQSEG